MKIQLKLLSQEFNADHFYEENATKYTVQARYEAGLITTQTSGVQVYAQKQTNVFIPNWVGMASWLGLIFPNLDTKEVETFRFTNPVSKAYGEQYTL